MWFKKRREAIDECHRKEFMALVQKSNEIDKIIRSLPHMELIEIYFKVQDKTWLAEIFGDMPEGLSVEVSELLARQPKEIILGHVGEKAILRYRYMILQGHSQEEFDDYWDSLVATGHIPKL